MFISRKENMRILLIDPHELFREGLRYVLQKLHGGATEILEAGDFYEGLTMAGQHPDLVLLELHAPGCDGAVSIKLFRRQFPSVPLVVVSSEEDRQVIGRALDYGANGFVCKSAKEGALLGALRLVLEGGVYVPAQYLSQSAPVPAGAVVGRKSIRDYGLTERQMNILGYLTAGLGNKEIGNMIGIAEGTVKVHVAAVFQALHVNSRTEAVRVAERLGLLDTSRLQREQAAK